jgi:hypothetical protein
VYLYNKKGKLREIAIGFFLIIFVSCESTPERIISFNANTLDTTSISSDSRLVAAAFYRRGRSAFGGFRSLVLFQVKQDTVIGDVRGKYVEVTYWNASRDSSVHESKWSELISINDSIVRLYDVYNGPRPVMGHGLFKSSAENPSPFFQELVFAIYPLWPGKSWKTGLSEPGFNDSLPKRQFLGIDTLGFENKKLECGIFTQQYQQGTDTSWVASFGMIKAKTRYWGVVNDSSGQDSTEDLEAYKLVSLNPSSAFIKKEIAEYLKIPVVPENMMP